MLGDAGPRLALRAIRFGRTIQTAAGKLPQGNYTLNRAMIGQASSKPGLTHVSVSDGGSEWAFLTVTASNWPRTTLEREREQIIIKQHHPGMYFAQKTELVVRSSGAGRALLTGHAGKD